MLADRSLARLSSKRFYQQLTETHADTASHWTEVGDPYGRVRRRIANAEEDGNPIGRPTIPTNPDSWELLETKSQTRINLFHCNPDQL